MLERVFVTGGAGFIGSHLVRRLSDGAAEITVFDSLHPQVHGQGATPPRFPGHVRFVSGDVRDAKALSAALGESRPHKIVHLAAETGTGQSWDEAARYCDVNVTGTAHLIEAVRQLPPEPTRRRLLLASSRSVYGEGCYLAPEGTTIVPPPRSPADMAAGRFDLARAGSALKPLSTREDAPPAPASIYASTKLMQEHVVQQGLSGTDIEVVILRFQNVYGPGQSLLNSYTGVLSVFCDQIMRGRTLNIFEDGEITRDFVFVDDAVNGIVAGLSNPDAAASIFNIGSGVGVTINEVASSLLGLFEGRASGMTISGDFRTGDVRHAVADISLARERMGWSPIVDLPSGLRRLVASVASGR